MKAPWVLLSTHLPSILFEKNQSFRFPCLLVFLNWGGQLICGENRALLLRKFLILAIDFLLNKLLKKIRKYDLFISGKHCFHRSIDHDF